MAINSKEAAVQYFQDLGEVLRSEPDREARKKFLAEERHGTVFPKAFDILRKDLLEKRQRDIKNTQLVEEPNNIPFLVQKGQPAVWGTQYLNEDAYLQEQSRFDQMIDSTKQISDQSVPIMPYPEYSRYKKLVTEHAEAVGVTSAINEVYIGSKTFSELMELDVLRVGVEFLIHDNLQRRLRILQQHAEGVIEPSCRLLRLLDFDAAEGVLKIDGVCLRDFVEEERRWKNSPSTFLHFLIKAGVMGHRDDNYEEISKDNKGELEELFPSTLQQHGRHMVRTVVSATQASPRLISQMGSRMPEMGKRGARVGKKLVENIQSFKEFIYKNILNPSSVASQEIMHVIEYYINGREDEKIYALLTLGLNYIDKTRNLYRSLLKAIDGGRASSAQRSLFSAIDILISKYPSMEDLPTLDDVQTIFDQDVPIQEPLSAISDLSRRIGTIFSISSERNHSLNPETIPWIDALALPQDIRVIFGDKPKNFTVKLNYENEIGEKINLRIQIDCEKETFDWSFLQDPDDERMERLRDALLTAVGLVLDAVQKNTTLDFEEKREAKAAQLAVVKTPSAAKKSQDRYIRPERSVQEHDEENTSAIITPIMRALQELQEEKKKGMPKNRIILPSDDVLNELLKEIGTYDHEKVLGVINRYNTQGGAGFSQLDTTGEPRYELKIGSKGVPKGIRAILIPSTRETSEKGIREFEIYGIWYRGESFKRHRRKKLEK